MVRKPIQDHRRNRQLLIEALEIRNLLSGTWTPTTVDYPIDDHHTTVAPSPVRRGVTTAHANTVADAVGTSTVGQFTDTLTAKASVNANTTMVGRLLNYSVKTQADVQKVDAVGQITGGIGTTKDVATQTYAFAEYYLQGKGVGIISLTVNTSAQYKHVWAGASGSSSETTTNLNTAKAKIDITVVGTFTVSVQAQAGNEEMDFTLSQTGGYDYARTQEAIASVGLSIITTGTYTVTATGNANCHVDGWYNYGSGAINGWQANSTGNLNVRSVGTRGTVQFSTDANRSFVSGYTPTGLAKETVYDANGSITVDTRTGKSSGRVTTTAQYDTQYDTHQVILPTHGSSRINTSATARVAPPADNELARQEIWNDVQFLEGLLFARSL